MDTETKVVIVKYQAQLKEPTKFEEDGKLLAQLVDINLNSIEQQTIADQVHCQEVISKTFKTIIIVLW